jgi:hypothetical protein
VIIILSARVCGGTVRWRGLFILLCFVSRIDLLISVVCLPPQNMSVVLLTRQYYHFFKACMCPPAQCPCYMNYLNVCLSAKERKEKKKKKGTTVVESKIESKP